MSAPRRTRRPALPAALAALAAVAIAGCSAGSQPPAQAVRATPATAPEQVVRVPAATAARAFATGVIEQALGRRPAAAVPYATTGLAARLATVRQQGPLAGPSARVRVLSTRLARQGDDVVDAEALVAAGTERVPLRFTLFESDEGGWLVDDIDEPDQPAPDRHQPARRVHTAAPAARAAAAAFARRYAAYTYGRLLARKVTPASTALTRQLAAEAPRVPASVRRRRPRVASIRVIAAGPGRAAATASVDDGELRFQIEFRLAMQERGWTVVVVEHD